MNFLVAIASVVFVLAWFIALRYHQARQRRIKREYLRELYSQTGMRGEDSQFEQNQPNS